MNMGHTYVFDDAVGVWGRRDRLHDVSYTDGEDVEDEMLSLLARTDDKSSGSDELNLPGMKWPLEYHFSASRAHLLTPFPLGGLDVLEIGAGCGALTRFLGEAATRSVVALEGSPRRAQIAAARCRDLSKVAVICDNFSRFETDRTFDVVVAVGVLEYAPVYFGGTDAVGSFLTKCRDLLNESGSLIIAIENQLGLKYFSGCGEDHAGKLFYGVQDLYDRDKGFVTFGREDLTRRILAAGFSSTEFFYPFPDYKLPSAIFSQAGMRDPDFSAGSIMAEQWARDYSVSRAHFFSEQAVWPVIARNLIGEDLSNSFLVFASKAGVSPLTSSVDWLVKLYNGYRRKRFRTVTTIKRTGGVIRVCKDRLHPEIPEQASEVVRMLVPQEMEYVVGESISHRLTRILLRVDTTIPDLVRALASWRNFLAKSLVRGSESNRQHLLPGHFLDCVPRNLIAASGVDQDPIYFDAEWDCLRPLPVQLVLFRGLLHCRTQCADGSVFSRTPLKTVMIAAFTQSGFELSERNLDEQIESEAEFQSLITTWDRDSWIEETLHVLDSPLPSGETFARITQDRDDLRLRLAESEANAGRMKNSLSWKLTAPLRRGYRLLQRIGGGSPAVVNILSAMVIIRAFMS